MKMQTLALAGMVTTAIGGIAYVFIYPLLSGERKAEQRLSSVARTEPAAARTTGRVQQRSRREQVEETLKDLDVKQKKSKNPPLQSLPLIANAGSRFHPSHQKSVVSVSHRSGARWFGSAPSAIRCRITSGLAPKPPNTGARQGRPSPDRRRCASRSPSGRSSQPPRARCPRPRGSCLSHAKLGTLARGFAPAQSSRQTPPRLPSSQQYRSAMSACCWRLGILAT